jgi:dihydrofolate synthase / folylpolyglutamate synthase
VRPNASPPAEPLAFLEALSPWPAHFGLERIRALLAELGDPQRRFPAIHVVGTNGKTSTTLMTAALLHAEGLSVGATISPHLRGWSERIQVDGEEADLARAVARVRPHAAGATQFEVITAAALAEFAARGVEVAVVEAGLGGRLDATNVLAAGIVVLTSVALDHTDVLGGSRAEIAAEKLAVVTPGSTVVLGEPEWEELARAAGAGCIVTGPDSNVALATEAARQFLGRTVDPRPARELRLPGRLERRSERPLEIWDGAHNPAGVAYLLAGLPARRFTIVASILADKDAETMLAALAATGDTLVATGSLSPRARPAAELARLAAPYFERVETVVSPSDAVARARVLAGPDGAVLVTGSLYLLSELSQDA